MLLAIIETISTLRIDLPEFEGKFDLYGFIDWINTTERVFAYEDP